MKNLIRTLQKYATGRAVLLLLIVTMFVYALILLYTIPAVLTEAPTLPLFDMSPMGYSYAEAVSLLDAIGESGRQLYRTLQLPVDFIYPGLFAVTYTLLLTWLFKRTFPETSPIFYLALVPAAAGLFDYLENVGIIWMLQTYPNISPAAVTFASICSVLKSICTIGFYLLLLFGLIAMARYRMGNRRGDAHG